jgi:predicted GNAT family acetyltransferase
LYDQLRIGNINSSAAEAKIAKKPDLLKSTNSAVPASLRGKGFTACIA